MMSHRSWFGLIGSAALLMACGAGTDEPDGPPGYMGPFNTAGAPNGLGGASRGGAGTTSNAVGNGQGGANGVTPTGAGGNAPTGGAGEGNVNPINAGGAGNNNSGNAGQAGTGAAGNGNGNGNGGFVSVTVNGGASAAFVCPDGPFGDPLAGMGQVQTINAPQGGGNFFSFIEGPVWIDSLERLFFSDNVTPERIWQLSAPFTTPSVFLQNSGSNGLAVDNQDRLVAADQAGNRVVRIDPSTSAVIGTIAPAGNYNPNDVIVRSDDNVYFTDANEARAFYRVSPGGQLSGPFNSSNATNAPGNPNGILLSPDENTLYVSNVFGRSVSAFSLLADGAVDPASGVIFADETGNTADGMAIDCAGNLYLGTDSGVEVYSPDGDFIGDIPTGYASNCTFGGADRRTLFVTSQNALKSVTLGVPGLPD
jgi:gluconolactonase